jgi:hypothetical protein
LIGPPETLVRKLQTFLDHGGLAPDALSDAKLGRFLKPRLSKIAHWARCPACRTTGNIDLRKLDWHRGAAAILPIVPAECAVCRTRMPIEVEACRRVLAERSGNGWVSD